MLLYKGTAPIIKTKERGKQKTIAIIEFEITFIWNNSVPKSLSDVTTPTNNGSNKPKNIDTSARIKAKVFTFLYFVLFRKSS